MFIIGNLFLALARVLDLVLTLYMFAVIARAAISWFAVNPYHPAVQLLRKITEPALSRIRRYVPLFGGIDLSPFVLILAIVFLQNFLVGNLYQLAETLK